MAKKIGLNTSKQKNDEILKALTKQVQEKKASQLLEARPVVGNGTPAGESTYKKISTVNTKIAAK